MDLCSILLYTRPECREAVGDALRKTDGIEIHAALPDGRMVVTVEGNDSARFSDIVLGLRGVDGVIDASLVYHFHENDFEDDQIELSEEID
uniref:Chaperone NapD n=1 Tax=Candidatus Kentrum sp. SD TaxID=2126332 RepID=A0A451BNI6_9GAMM|nr:MAG: periplasmic nitrate reductase chaperone NapD [Candidatus Kentron sp. SD]VFK45565.1 MAG: periplasmic nitrate reductase chaperone NapD [Candidatus Kentron sp. SD]VFK79844.1 MAG: periplasmic nitrate reductase chaperone NapD [Candidatus Kentron sp. SD]